MNQGKNTILLTKKVRIAAYYLILAAVIGILLPLIWTGSEYPEYQAKTLAYKMGYYSRESLINVIFFISGVGLLCKKVWAKKMALSILAFNLIYSVNNYAWGYAGGEPTLNVLIGSFIVMSLWNGTWFFLILKAKYNNITT